MDRDIDPPGQQRLFDLLGEKPLAAGLASSRSWIMSPDVRITSIATASGAKPCAAAKRSRVSRAWTSASGEPREPIRKIADCAIEPHNATP
jgi:hypothetical protein